MGWSALTLLRGEGRGHSVQDMCTSAMFMDSKRLPVLTSAGGGGEGRVTPIHAGESNFYFTPQTAFGRVVKMAANVIDFVISLF